MRLLQVNLITPILAAGLAACGGGNDADPVTVAPTSLDTNGSSTQGTGVTSASVTVSGKVLNVGYLGNTKVCADLNDDGACDSGDPQTVTDANGNYMLTVPASARGVTLLAQVLPTSTDSGSTASSPVPIARGWTWAAPLEYDDGATAVSQNITPVTSTYWARMHATGRNRLSNRIATFARIVFEPDVDPATGQMLTSVDFDYVADPRNTLVNRVRALSNVLSQRATANGPPLNLLMTAGVMSGWYNTYVAPSGTAAGLPADANKIAALAGNNTPESYVANDYRYAHLGTDAPLRFRNGVSNTAGWTRVSGAGDLATFDRRMWQLIGGQIQTVLNRWSNGGWSDLTVAEASYLTWNSGGDSLALNAGTDYLQPRSISFANGNRITFQSAHSNARVAYDLADIRAIDWALSDWLPVNRNYAMYYNGAAPSNAPLSAPPASCNRIYGTNTPGTGKTASDWFNTCYTYFQNEYLDQVLHDSALTAQSSTAPGATYYDAWFKDAALMVPLTTQCTSGNNQLPTVTVLGQTHCNWAVDAHGGHTMADLFSPGGVTLNSWTATYGTATFSGSGGSTTVTAGSPAQAGLPMQLTLTLDRSGNAVSGTGTLSSPYGAWTSGSHTPTSETVQWQIDPQHPNVVLLSWPFLDVNDPRVKPNARSDGSRANAAPVLTAHFAGSWSDAAFSLAPATRTSVNYNRLAIVLQDGVFMTGQYYGAGYTYSERYMPSTQLDRGRAAIGYIYGRLYGAGFIDR